MNSNVIESIVTSARLTKARAAALRTLLRTKGEEAASEALTYVVTHANESTDIERIERLLGFNLAPVASSGNEVKIYEVPQKKQRRRNIKWYHASPLHPAQ